MTKRRIALAVRFRNGMVAVCDQHKRQIAELQGPYEQVYQRVLEQSDDQTEWIGQWDKKERVTK